MRKVSILQYIYDKNIYKKSIFLTICIQQKRARKVSIFSICTLKTYLFYNICTTKSVQENRLFYNTSTTKTCLFYSKCLTKTCLLYNINSEETYTLTKIICYTEPMHKNIHNLNNRNLCFTIYLQQDFIHVL